MSETPEEETTVSIPDEDLPEDLQPTDDNPLAKPLDPDADEDEIHGIENGVGEGMADMGDGAF